MDNDISQPNNAPPTNNQEPQNQTSNPVANVTPNQVVNNGFATTVGTLNTPAMHVDGQPVAFYANS